MTLPRGPSFHGSRPGWGGALRPGTRGPCSKAAAPYLREVAELRGLEVEVGLSASASARALGRGQVRHRGSGGARRTLRSQVRHREEHRAQRTTLRVRSGTGKSLLAIEPKGAPALRSVLGGFGVADLCMLGQPCVREPRDYLSSLPSPPPRAAPARSPRPSAQPTSKANDVVGESCPIRDDRLFPLGTNRAAMVARRRAVEATALTSCSASASPLTALAASSTSAVAARRATPGAATSSASSASRPDTAPLRRHPAPCAIPCHPLDPRAWPRLRGCQLPQAGHPVRPALVAALVHRPHHGQHLPHPAQGCSASCWSAWMLAAASA